MLLKAPTIKQMKFVKAYFETGSKKAAAKAAYNTNNPESMAMAAWRTEGVQYLMRKELEARGLTTGKLSDKWTKLLKKTTPRGRINDPRLHFDVLKETTKLSGLYPAEKKEIQQKTARFNLDLNAKSPEELSDVLSKLQAEITQFKKLVDSKPGIVDSQPKVVEAEEIK